MEVISSTLANGKTANGMATADKSSMAARTKVFLKFKSSSFCSCLREGEWADDRRHGQGTEKLASGETWSGTWEYDRRVGEGKLVLDGMHRRVKSNIHHSGI